MEFRLQPIRFTFRALETIHFPAGQSANILRGALGTIFRRLGHSQMFEPAGPAPSGFANWPRPFVFRASHLDGLTVQAGEQFHFDMRLFDWKRPAAQFVIEAFQQLAKEGLGTGRKKVELLLVEEETLILPLDRASGECRRLLIRFVTPTELKSGSRLVDKPEFRILAGRVRDRISMLCELYGDGAPQIDFKGFGERAARVRMTRCNVRTVEAKRRSTRTGQVHSIGGFVGEAEYEGDLAEFVPWLNAARWTGVGRQTVWGKGMFETEFSSALLYGLPASSFPARPLQ